MTDDRRLEHVVAVLTHIRMPYYPRTLYASFDASSIFHIIPSRNPRLIHVLLSYTFISVMTILYGYKTVNTTNNVCLVPK